MEKTLSKIKACLVGVAIGDALGMPWETMTFEEIKLETQKFGARNFTDPKQTRLKDTMNCRPGDTTDDWLLTKALVDSIIEKGDFEIIDSAEKQIQAFRQNSFGFGRTTIEGLEELEAYFKSNGKEGRSPFDRRFISKPGKGCGNGVAMKIAPLAILRAIKDKTDFPDILAGQALSFGFLTHPDPRASIAGYAIANLIGQLILADTKVSNNKQLFQLLSSTLKGIIEIEDIYKSELNGHLKVSDQLEKLLSFDFLTFPEMVRNELKTSCYSLESIPFSIATFMRHPTDFEKGVLEAVNAGGDTDTNAAMVGALIGANLGLEGIPSRMINFRQEFKDILKLAEKFYSAINS